MSGVEAMIMQAEKSIGLREPNYIQSWYRGRNGAAYSGNFAWCNAAITYWAFYSGNHAEVCYGTDYAYTVSHANRFRTKGAWHAGTKGIRRGDIVFFDWAGKDVISAIDHVGLVTGVRADGKVLTIEGNSANVCARRVRGSLEIAGYGRPVYKSTAPKPVPKPKPVVKSVGPWGSKPSENTKVVQRALNKEFGLKLKVDGVFGKVTKAAYARWQKKLGLTGVDADGIPGPWSLGKLGAKRGFTVK